MKISKKCLKFHKPTPFAVFIVQKQSAIDYKNKNKNSYCTALIFCKASHSSNAYKNHFNEKITGVHISQHSRPISNVPKFQDNAQIQRLIYRNRGSSKCYIN